MSAAQNPDAIEVLRIRDLPHEDVKTLLSSFQLDLVVVPDGLNIEGSYWGESEAGLVGRSVYVRSDTPIHSLLHETSHAICMSDERRATLHRDAGGDDLEECAVCYLQILLADMLPCVGRGRMMRDMDSWGYSFRLGNTAAWFDQDSHDAREWLKSTGLLTPGGAPRRVLRGN